MPSLLVVDDTELIRNTINNIVSKEDIAISAVYEAENGEQAVSIARRHHPDIIFMDIKMPGMNGLQATAVIRKEFPDTKIVMLTAYDEFSFVQEALQLGAVDYLLKPVRPSKLVEVIGTMKTKLEEDAERQRVLVEVRQRLSEVLPIVEANLVDDLIYAQSLGEEMIHQNLQQLNKELTISVVMMVSINNFDKIVKRLQPQQILDKYNELTQIIRRTIHNPAKALFGSWQLGQLAVILSTDFQWETIDAQKGLGEQIRQEIDRQLNIPVTISFGRRYPSWADIAISFAEARSARQYSKRDGSGVVHVADMTGLTAPHGYAYPLALEKELLESIRLKQEDISLELMNALVDHLLYNYKDTPQILYSYFAELLSLISRNIIDMGALAPAVLDQSHRQMTILFSGPSPAQLRLWALNSVTELLSVTAFKTEKPSRDAVQLAIEYIHKNYHNPELTLGEVANTVGLSQSHLAFLLKERTGMSYSKYLSNLRIRHAKKLLRTTSMTISTIAEVVGYPNATHFYRIFQRQTEMTPKTYRETAVA
ncbi:MAG: response regulator [Anaerolineales bacterium]|nr:response regulator [Anaerolineales bacterium]